MLWFVLFFGGSVLPALTGVCLTSVPEECRAVASSFSMFTYNILGYAMAPVLMGFIADSHVRFLLFFFFFLFSFFFFLFSFPFTIHCY